MEQLFGTGGGSQFDTLGQGGGGFTGGGKTAQSKAQSSTIFGDRNVSGGAEIQWGMLGVVIGAVVAVTLVFAFIRK